MANYPDDFQNHSTLEAVEHHPDVFPLYQSDAKFANNPGYSTLESTYCQPNNNQNGAAAYATEIESSVATKEEYSTLKAQTPHYDSSQTEKGAGGTAAVGGADAPKENWKTRKVFGIPSLFLPIGLVVVLVVIGAVVGGVVATRPKKDNAQPADLQSTSDHSGAKHAGETSTQTTGSTPSATVDTNGKITTPSSTSKPIDQSKWKQVEWPSNKYYMMGMGADSVATFWWLGYNSTGERGDTIMTDDDRGSQDGRTVIADNHQWQFESAKEANIPDDIALEYQGKLPSMAYLLHNKAREGFVLGFDKTAFDEYEMRNATGGKTTGMERFPLSLMPANRSDTTQMWMVYKSDDSRWPSYGDRDWHIITNYAATKEDVDPYDWHLHYSGLASHSSNGDDMWWIKDTGQAAPDLSTLKYTW